MRLAEWAWKLVCGIPHKVIGGELRPYMKRWYLIPRNRWLNVYLHQFLRDDDDRALHDHPWWFMSFMLWGRYREHFEKPIHSELLAGGAQWISSQECSIERRAPSFAFRRAAHRHRVELMKRDGMAVPCWTIVITGRRVREWGFWCPQGFVHWQQFTSADGNEVGRGCD